MSFLIPEDYELWLILELVDFEFVYEEEELENRNYLVDDRNTIVPIQMFKYLLLRVIYKMSDRDLIKRTKTDLAFKFFLNMAPEEVVINPSSLTKSQCQRLKNKNLLDTPIAQSVQLAIDHEIFKSGTIIVDATHAVSRFNQKSPIDILCDHSKRLRKAAYGLDQNLGTKFPAKTTINDLEIEKIYALEVIKKSTVSTM